MLHSAFAYPPLQLLHAFLQCCAILAGPSNSPERPFLAVEDDFFRLLPLLLGLQLKFGLGRDESPHVAE